MIDNIRQILLGVFLLLVFFGLGWVLRPCPEPAIRTKTVYLVKQAPPEKRDSIPAKYIPYAVTKILWKERIVLRYMAKQGLQVDTANSTDSAIIVKPFVAKSDTVTFGNGSKVAADYTFPSENPFRFYYKPAPDTTREISIIVDTPWYEKPVVVSTVTATILTAIYLLFNNR